MKYILILLVLLLLQGCSTSRTVEPVKVADTQVDALTFGITF